MKQPATFNDLIEEANRLDLYKNLIVQLNKDFLLANIEVAFNEDMLPSSLKSILQDTIYKLIHEKFADYLKLLYIIDISETKVKQLDVSNIVLLSEQVSFLILLREWQKVWFKRQY